MRTTLVYAVVLGALVLPQSARGQSYPAEMVITLGEVEVRSGPTKEYYATSKVRYGDRVLVLRDSKDQPGWLAIKPPPGSFSWISAKAVKQVNGQLGYVDSEAGAMLRPGSAVANKPPDIESVKVPFGSQVTILDKSKTAPDGTVWLPIQPWPTEVRFIPGEAVQARQFASANNSVNFNGPGVVFASNPLIGQADQALQAGNVERAKQLYKEAAEKTGDNNQRAYCYGRLASLSQSPWSAAQAPGNPAQMAVGSPGPVGQTASFTQTAPAPQKTAAPPVWSPVGVLRRATFDKDGQPTYALEDPRTRGQTLLYVTCQPGMTLRDYVGRTVALYGSINYRSDDLLRTNFMSASHVAVY